MKELISFTSTACDMGPYIIRHTEPEPGRGGAEVRRQIRDPSVFLFFSVRYLVRRCVLS